MYNVEFLPIAMKDMVEIARYISVKLDNPIASERLADKFITLAESLSDMPYKYSVYHPIKPLGKEYRRLPVDNYIMFYYVDEVRKIVTIARVIYGKRKYEQLLT